MPKALFLCVDDLSGQRYAHAEDQWLVRPPSVGEADLLKLPQGASVIHLVHAVRASDGQILEISESVWSADQFTDLVLDLQAALTGLPLPSLVPVQWLHLTVQPIGWADQHSAEAVERVAELARDAVGDIGPIEVEFGPAAVKVKHLCFPRIRFASWMS